MNLTRHFLHVPWPPQVESIAMPFQLAASKRVTPCGTRTGRPLKRRSIRWVMSSCSAAFAARNAAIQAAPQSSWPSSRSAARAAVTTWGVRASMIALVRPCAAASGRNAAVSACRSGMPNDRFDAPQVVLTPNSSLTSARVSSVRMVLPVSAPTGIASGSMTMSSTGIW